jgi:hypothetical protein
MSIVGEPPPSQPSTSRKDVWDKLAIVLPFVSGLLIAGIGGYFTYIYNRQSNRLAELETLQPYIAQLSGPEEVRKTALRIINTFASKEMQLALAEISREGTAQQREVAIAALIAAAAVVFDNSNISDVANGGTSPIVTFSQAQLITSIRTYHWNNAQGAPAGTHMLRRDDGMTFGPWPVVASSGFQGAPNVDWTSKPAVTVPAGRYTVIDSNPSTWSQNTLSGGAGFVTIKATPTN